MDPIRYYLNKLFHYMILIIPLAIVGIIFYFVANDATNEVMILVYTLKFFLENMKMILFISLLVAIVVALIMTQWTRVKMLYMKKDRDKIKEKSSIRKMRLGVVRE